jgi:DNA adenine methylase
MREESIRLLRYPGGKQRQLRWIMQHLPSREEISGYFVEPFLGSAAVFFRLNPKRAILADVNCELVTLYRGLRRDPIKVWEIFRSLPSTKNGYYRIRNATSWPSDLASQAARTLYLNRTCFKGMWRHNSEGQFNIGYGGQDRRWVISKQTLLEVSKRLRKSLLRTSDFEDIVEMTTCDDFLFLDPPYRPGERELLHAHYIHSRFTYSDHKRLGQALQRASRRGVKWGMTICSHPDILRLYNRHTIIPIPKGTKKKSKMRSPDSGQVLVLNN